jgi:aminodeoxyfutalosine deaminase
MGSFAPDLSTLPKVELHVHLEGTVAATTAAGLARRHGEDPDDVLVLEDGDYPRRFEGFDHFLRTFLATSAQVRTPDDLATIAAAFATAQADQRVVWSEATFTAVTMVRRGMEPGPMWRALRDGFAEASDTRIGLIVDTPRDLGPDAMDETLRLVESADAPVVALGLTGIEGSRPERDFAPLRAAADRLGIGLVVHAGEIGTATNVRAALDDLGADRIGHGVASVTDAALLERLARDRVVLEVCPSSNVTLGIAASLEAHPIRALRDAGVALTVNSDDPPFFSTTLTDELGHATRLLALSGHEVADLQRRALAASYAPADVRREAAARIDAWDADAGA